MQYVGDSYTRTNTLTFHTLDSSVALHRCVCLPSLSIDITKYYSYLGTSHTVSYPDSFCSCLSTNQIQKLISGQEFKIIKCFTERAQMPSVSKDMTIKLQLVAVPTHG